MKVIIAGGRFFDNYDLLNREVSFILMKLKITDSIEIVSGTARGADKLGEYYAINNKFNIKRFPADWDKYGRSAGYIRNKEMAEYADVLIAFWDGKSRGTKHMIDLARKKELKVYIINY